MDERAGGHPPVDRAWAGTVGVDAPASERIAANIAAIEILKTLQSEQRQASEDERPILAGWTGWGGLTALFDRRDNAHTSHLQRLDSLLTAQEFEQAQTGVLSQFFTPPQISEAIWHGLRWGAGIESGHGLEPGCGAGTFIAHAPSQVRMTGVEVDAITAGIASYLYPGDEIRHEGYEKTPTTRWYDFTVGNVPFGELRLHDQAHNPGNHTIHNHFILKALAQTKPGGYVAVVTSHHTMDATNPAARRDMYERADLAAALRLPSGTFGSTQAVCDILVFRVRKEGEEPKPFKWETTTALRVDGQPTQVQVNTAFATRVFPTIGTPTTKVGMYGAMGLVVERGFFRSDESIAADVSKILGSQLQTARLGGLPYEPSRVERDIYMRTSQYASDYSAIAHHEAEIGAIRHAPGKDRVFEQLTQEGWQEIRVAKSHYHQMTLLLAMRDTTHALLEAERTTVGDSPTLDGLRRDLARQWRYYTGLFGPLNAAQRVTRTHKDKDGEIEERVSYRTHPVMKTFRTDPGSALTLAIEVYDEDTGIAQPAGLLNQRQLFAPYEPKGADSPADAVAISRAQKGKVDLEYCAYLLSALSPQQARTMLGDLVFDTPDGEVVIREEYLSGNVRRKLAQAEEAAVTNPAFQANVEALKEVMPADLGVADVVPTIGATWVAPADYQAFMKSLDIITTVQYTPATGWKLSKSYGNADQHVYGSRKKPATQIMEDLLNAKPLQVTYPDPDAPANSRKQIVDHAATEVANGHAQLLQEAFAGWLFSEPERTTRLLAVYNERFNSLVPRSYEHAGDELHLAGLAGTFTLHKHQRTAVALMIAEPTTGLFHEVGAGKTLEMVCGVMEQKRLGLIHKPMVVVPNHMLRQFEREWLQAYPGARLLCASGEGFDADKRRELLAKATTSEWDAVIVTQSAFKRIPVRAETEEEYNYQRLHELDEWMDNNRGTISFRAAQMARERLRNRLEKEAEKRREQADRGVTFEDLGVDYLVIDEAHDYKNLAQPTNTNGLVASNASARSRDLQMKLGYLRSTYGERVATFATATPVANAMGEMYVMTSYLRPDLLQEAGIDTFDAWVNTFTTTKTQVEVTMTGQLKVKQRISQFHNLPELITQWRTFADVKRRHELDLVVPQLEPNRNGQRSPRVVSVNVGPAMDAFNKRLLKRGEALESGGVPASQDNYLSLVNDARAVATDSRLLSPQALQRCIGQEDLAWSARKIDAVAANVARIYHATKDNTYSDEANPSQISATPGALQLVFCDLGTPKTGWNLYDELKTQLVMAGVPEEKIVFVHEASTSTQKDEIFARARSGSISVLIGSTQKMGTGANMQKRAIALHHVTCPWRPCDITQREGRIIRQGNENSEVGIYRYVTEGSFDAFLWQTVERKASFINSVMDARIVERTIESVDLSQDEINFAQVKAIASGNPLEIEVARLSNEVTSLSRRSKQWEREYAYFEKMIPSLRTSADRLQRRAAELDQAIQDNNTDDELVIARQPVTSEMNQALHTHLLLATRYISGERTTLVGSDIEYAGKTLKLFAEPFYTNAKGDRIHPWELQYGFLRDTDTDCPKITFTSREVVNESTDWIRRLRNYDQQVRSYPDKLREEAERNLRSADQMEAQLGASNPWDERLQQAKAHLVDVRRELKAHQSGQDALPTMNADDSIQARARSMFDVAAQSGFTPSRTQPSATERTRTNPVFEQTRPNSHTR